MTQSTNQDELRDVWYEKLDDYVYWINRYSQRNQRKEREAKMHLLISEIQSELTKRQLEMLERIDAEVVKTVIANPSYEMLSITYSGVIEAERNKLKEMK